MPEAKSDSAPEPATPLLRFLRRLLDVTSTELPALGWCWLYIFSVLASYYILRPIRDQMGVASGVNNLSWLFTGTLIAMLVLKYLQLRARRGWSLSNLIALLRMNLFTHRDLWAWLEQPFEGPPGMAGPVQEALALG